MKRPVFDVICEWAKQIEEIRLEESLTHKNMKQRQNNISWHNKQLFSFHVTVWFLISNCENPSYTFSFREAHDIQ